MFSVTEANIDVQSIIGQDGQGKIVDLASPTLNIDKHYLTDDKRSQHFDKENQINVKKFNLSNTSLESEDTKAQKKDAMKLKKLAR